MWPCLTRVSRNNKWERRTGMCATLFSSTCTRSFPDGISSRWVNRRSWLTRRVFPRTGVVRSRRTSSLCALIVPADPRSLGQCSLRGCQAIMLQYISWEQPSEDDSSARLRKRASRLTPAHHVEVIRLSEIVSQVIHHLGSTWCRSLRPTPMSSRWRVIMGMYTLRGRHALPCAIS